MALSLIVDELHNLIYGDRQKQKETDKEIQTDTGTHIDIPVMKRIENIS